MENSSRNIPEEGKGGSGIVTALILAAVSLIVIVVLIGREIHFSAVRFAADTAQTDTVQVDTTAVEVIEGQSAE